MSRSRLRVRFPGATTSTGTRMIAGNDNTASDRNKSATVGWMLDVDRARGKPDGVCPTAVSFKNDGSAT